MAATLAGCGLSTKVTQILLLQGGVFRLPDLVAMVREPFRHSHCVILPSWQVTISILGLVPQAARGCGQATRTGRRSFGAGPSSTNLVRTHNLRGPYFLHLQLTASNLPCVQP